MITAVLALLWLAAPPDWTILFDGQAASHWRSPLGAAFPASSWRIEDGLIYPVRGLRNIDLFSAASYRNFELEFEFKLEPGANGGIKYLVQGPVTGILRENRWISGVESDARPGELYAEGAQGLEFQIVDDDADEAKDAKRRSGSLYSLVAPSEPPPIGPGVFHRGRIVVNGDKIEHYLNSKRVLAIVLGSPEMEAAWDACRRGDIKRMRRLPKREGPVVITHHGSRVSYRNIRIRPLP